MDQAQAKNGINRLPLADLADRHRGLTAALAEVYREAAGVCLARHHSSPAEFSIRNESSNVQALAEWSPPDERTRAAYANRIDTTEYGAYGCAIAAVELAEGLFVVRRAETMTGADYYIAGAGAAGDDLEGCLRLEVSGTDKGTPASLNRLLFAKIEQAKAGRSGLPALAAVVGFKSLLICIERAANDELGY
jgi:hypothetical protein